ncbi:MAG TPA: hypothetical protein DEG55_00830, partial [Acidaminococcaceae bacterium]|nr:hypothetical protein [Acidaminococcaceae bacterium]
AASIFLFVLFVLISRSLLCLIIFKNIIEHPLFNRLTLLRSRARPVNITIHISPHGFAVQTNVDR